MPRVKKHQIKVKFWIWGPRTVYYNMTCTKFFFYKSLHPAMRPSEVRLQKGPCGWGLMNFLIKGAHLAVAYIENVQSSKMTHPTVYGIIHKDINIFLKYTVSLTGRHGLLEVSNVPTYTHLYISFVYSTAYPFTNSEKASKGIIFCSPNENEPLQEA